MKRFAAVLLCFVAFLCSYSQKVQTIVPKQAIVGNAFQIQYIISDPSTFEGISPPIFDNLELISGPNYYKGNSLVGGKTQAIENITYTVVPLKAGTIKINPVIARFKNSEETKSDEVTVIVLPQPRASFNALSTYTDINLYAPSSKTDLDKLIEANLFIKTEVDKRICFLGQAITATFKLYSRLQSTSEVINAPSLYGFSVMDVLNINEAHQAVETIDGKVFNTSVLRKLQLYPAQTGKLTIDEMQLQNSIEFSDSSTGKKIKVEKLLASNPVDIMVKPLPSKQPADYTGAVGRFTISANMQATKINANAQGKLIIIINGRGNFIQFGSPAINWPKEFDVFDPLVSDELNKNVIPTEGTRKYIFSFTTDRRGSYIIPPVSFSFFDPSSEKYEKVQTDSVRFEIIPVTENQNKLNKRNEVESKSRFLIYFFGGVLLLMIAFVLFRIRKKQSNGQTISITKPDYFQKLNEMACQQLNAKQFCSEIHKLLSEVKKEYNLSIEQDQELQAIRNDCQLLIYSDVDSDGKREELQKRTETFIKLLSSDHSAYL